MTNLIEKWESRNENYLKYETFIADLKNMMGIEEIQLMENTLIEEIQQEIHKDILLKSFKLGENLSFNRQIFAGILGNSHYGV